MQCMVIRRLVVACLAASGMGFYASSACAHKPPSERALLLQLDQDGAVALWRLKLGGPKSQLLRVAHDTDRDGQFSASERRRLALALLSRAVGGVRFFWDGREVAATGLAPRLEQGGPQNQVSALGLSQLQLPQRARTRDGELEVRLAAGERRAPLRIMLQALGPWRVVDAGAGGLAADGQGLDRTVLLEPGEALRVRLARRLTEADRG